MKVQKLSSNKAIIIMTNEELNKRKIEVIEDDLVSLADGTIKHNSLKLSADIFSYIMR